ncbi:hypothetical protein [Microbulbifer sediminum]|nr:hypothetical protein [Microbulbifer sediminum]
MIFDNRIREAKQVGAMLDTYIEAGEDSRPLWLEFMNIWGGHPELK